MASLTDIFPGLTVSATEVQKAEILAEQTLQSKFPALDLREGTGIRDTVIRPFATLLAMTNKALDLYFSQNTIDKIDDTSSTSMVDSIMSNWFMYRNLGSKATINVRLFFARNKNVSIPSDTFFSTDNVLKFFIGSNTYISSGDMTLDTYSNEYYADVNLIAENAGVDYNLSSGSLLYFSSFDPYFLRAEINYLSTEAGNPETNTQFIARAKTAISTRNLINNPSIVANLQAQYPAIANILPIGYGDSQMIRDRVSVTVPSSVDPVIINIGGCVDVYCRTPLEYAIIQLTADSLGRCMFPGPILDVTRSQVSGGTDEDTLPYYLTSTASSLTSTGSVATFTATANHGYSNGDTVTISGATPTGYNVTANITVTGLTTFTYPITGSLTSPATGTIIAQKKTPYNLVRNHNYEVAPLVGNVTSSGTTVTVTSTNHAFVANRYVTVSGANQSAYNGSYLVTAVTKNTITYTANSVPSASPATGTIYVSQLSSNYDITFSDRNTTGDSTLYADFGAGYANLTASFQVLRYSLLTDIQGYLDDPDYKVVAGNYIARGFNVYYLDVGVTAYNGPSPDATSCQKIINTYLNSLEPGAIFVMGDLISQLYAGGITNIQTPLTVTYKKYTRDMILPAFTGTITDYLDPNDTTSIFYLNAVTTNNTAA